MNRQEILKKIEEKKNELAVNQGLYSPTSEMFRRFEVQLIAYTKCENYVQQLDESQKPVVPTCAEPWLKQAQYSSEIISLFSEVEYATDTDGFISKNWQWSPEFYDWLVEDADTLYLLCDALRYGYEVVKEPLYYVKDKENGLFLADFSMSGKSNMDYLFISPSSKVIPFTNKEKATAVALLVDGEVAEG